MKKLADILPMTLFFITYYFSGFLEATKILVMSTMFFYTHQLINQPWRPYKKHIGPLSIIILGCLTLSTQNEKFIVWKPTIMYLISASAIIGSQLIYKASILQKMFAMETDQDDLIVYVTDQNGVYITHKENSLNGTH